MMNNKKKSIVVIIGSGIGGLTCGCYLAKAGIKVIVIEQHSKPGGYCVSFERKRYRFDVGIHYLVGIKNGSLGKILDELDIQKSIQFNQFDPTDKIIMPDYHVYIRTNLHDTIHGFIRIFPKEKKRILNFFGFILQDDFLSIYSKAKRMTFQEILNHFFKNNKLKSTLEVLLGNIGASATRASAISGILVFREFLSDPGWYPEGGVNVYTNTLVNLIKNYNGEVIFNRKVEKIIIKENEARGVVLNDCSRIMANAVVSNADLTQTFSKLLHKRNMATDNFPISPAIFSVYLGLKKNANHFIKEPATVWSFSTYNVNDCYSRFNTELVAKKLPRYVTCILPSLHNTDASCLPTMELLTAAPFATNNFWNKYRNSFMEKLITKAEETFPNLGTFIDFKINATPQTFYRYTLNRNGSAYGWLSVPKFVTMPVFPCRTQVKNLFIAGHWCNGALSQGGIPQVSITGRTAAKLTMENLGVVWRYDNRIIL